MKTIFIIPGFKHSAANHNYKWLVTYLKTQGFVVRIVPIKWSYRTMSEWVRQFEKYYLKHQTDENIVFGFSFGAMISLICAASLKPDQLVLCSPSPYFSEDIVHLKLWWRKYIGKNRLEDFKRFSANTLAYELKTPVTIIYGEKEAEQYPRLKHRAENIADLAVHSKLLVAKEAPHSIAHSSYKSTIKQVLQV